MPSKKETVRINIPVTPELDKRATTNLIRDIKALEKELAPIKFALKDVTSKAHASVQELKKLSSTVGSVSKKLSRSLDETNDGLKRAVKSGGGGSRTGGGGQGLPRFADLEDDTDSLGIAFASLHKSLKSQKNTTDKVTKAQDKFQKGLKSAKFDHFKKGSKQFFDSIPRIFEAKRGGGGGARHVAGHGLEAGRGLHRMMRRGAPDTNERVHYSRGGGGTPGQAKSGGGTGAGTAGAIGVGALTLGIAAIVAFVKVLEMASQSQVKLNKALIDGTGTARDFGLSAGEYKETIDDLRNAVQDTTGTLLKFGGTSETTAKVINAFAKESTGSLAQTRNELYKLGTGDIQAGVLELTKSSMAYGKALGMGAEESAAMMGKFTTEMGYGAQGSIDLMGDIVKAAATSNMPMTKFMSIFNQVIPDVELYQNRLEELTGTVKLLSKTMSAKDVKNFMDAFANGFKGTDFKQRLKTVLVAGTANVSKALEADFNSKAQVMAKNFHDVAGIDPEEFVKAFHGGEKTMSALINKAQANAAKQGKQLSGTMVSDAMKAASYEATRKKGGALNLATAMRGGGTLATYKILSQYGQTLTKGFDGLSEHVIKQLGISEQQYDALRTTAQGLRVQRDQLKEFGKTNSKSMNTSLRETVKLRKKGMTEKEIEEAMRNATDDELFQASEMSNAMQKDNEKAFDLAEEHYKVTSSIGDQLDNVISFLLEQILRVLNPILDVLNDLLSWTTSSDKEAQNSITDMSMSIKNQAKKLDISEQVDAMVDSVSESVKKGLASGKTGTDLGKYVADSGVLGDINQIDPKMIYGILRQNGKDERDSATAQEAFYQAQKKNDPAKALEVLNDELGGKMESTIMALTQKLAYAGVITDSARARMVQTKRPGAVRSKTPDELKAEKDAKKASDIADLDSPVNAADFAPGAGPAASAGLPPAVSFADKVKDALTGKASDTKPEEHLEVAQASSDQLKETGKIAEDQLSTEERDYQNTTDLLSLMKKGIKYEQSWMGTKYKNVLKDATLDSFRTALLEFAIIQSKMFTSPDFQSKMADQGWNVLHSGQSLADIASYNPKADEGGKDWNKMMGYATGGPVDYDQIAKVHGGEFVVPRGGTLVKGAGGGNNYNINAIINVQTDADPKQISEAVHDLYRQH